MRLSGQGNKSLKEANRKKEADDETKTKIFQLKKKKQRESKREVDFRLAIYHFRSVSM